MPPIRRNTPHLTTTAIITGDFHEKTGYAVWREGGTQDWLLIYTAAGRGRFGLGSERGAAMANPGDAYLLRPGTLHDYGIAAGQARWDLLWAHFQPRPHWLDWLQWPAAAGGAQASGLMRLTLSDAAVRRRVHRRLAEMHALATGSSARRDALALNALEETLLLLDSVNPLQAQARIDPRIRATMDFLCRRLDEKLTLDLLAHRVNLSVSRLSHLFRQQTGVTPQQFLELQRLDRAKQLLALTPSSIKEIAYQVGFSNPFYFTLRFKRYTSLSPKAYRRSL